MTSWFTSDTHWGHRAVLKYGRENYFTDLDHHDKGLIAAWRLLVKETDTVYHLGDISFHKLDETRKIFELLPGKIHVIKGNHDRSSDLDKLQADGLIEGWDTLKRVSVITNDAPNLKKADQIKQNIVLCHFPLLVWDQAHRGTWHLHGHCHGNLSAPETTRIDVGVDAHGFAPVSFENIAVLMSDRTYTGSDHHQ